MATVNAIYKALNEIVLNPKYADLFALVKAARNGAVYGAKIRFPHALVMIFLFRSGTFKEKARLVYKATRTHAQNLARFAVIYKSCMIALRRLGSTAQPAHRQGVECEPADRDIHLRACGTGTGEAERGAEHGLRVERAAVE
ncbi:hypothetical protein V496_06478 [Pseudogymnoascus sp. VKM F-4515 (FW-2607)]|nr:hypothetical protein V496_06478 [Pseudogymnoascus sp. VKM F-4515 (FW-2607)]KFY87578.1 hypothetical protein V498_07110 [Pseudogymnoascus sp. VKM F-4517 (FW-2822)]